MSRFHGKGIRNAALLILSGIVGGSISEFHALAQAKPAPSAQPPKASHMQYQPDRFAGRAGRYYSLIWGVDSLSVKWAEQGEILRFSYRILDPERAKTLNNKELEPSLIDPQAGVKLVVPALEQVGILRQSGAPEAGKVYWMAFSNSGRRVKRGDRVTIQIGEFRAVGLVVD
jgi:hypothetical protein